MSEPDAFVTHKSRQMIGKAALLRLHQLARQWKQEDEDDQKLARIVLMAFGIIALLLALGLFIR